VGKPEVNKQLAEPTCRWKVNIKTDQKETEWERVGWIHLARDCDQWRAIVNPVINLQVPQNTRNFLTS